jgi:hypothetical protein
MERRREELRCKRVRTSVRYVFGVSTVLAVLAEEEATRADPTNARSMVVGADAE